jgi:hypothetical protein
MRHKMSIQEVMTQKAADGAAAGSAFLAGTAWVAEVEPIVTLAAGLVAIIAGGAAAWYHIERAKYMHRKNREEL